MPALLDMLAFRPTQKMIETLAKAITENVFDRVAPRHTHHGPQPADGEDETSPLTGSDGVGEDNNLFTDFLFNLNHPNRTNFVYFFKTSVKKLI